MSTITLKNVPEELHEELKLRAKAHQRSLNREVIATLLHALDSEPLAVDTLLKEARAVREPIQAYVTQSTLQTYISDGRQ